MFLGKGTYGSVVEENGKAIKKFKSRNTMMKELFYLSFFKDCPNICQIIDYNCTDKTITMEKYECNLCELSKKIPFSKRVELITSIVKQVLIALKQMHTRGIIHGDLILNNVFCNYNERNNEVQCYVGDFSLTTIFNFNRYDNATCYPPEDTYGTKFDIWCLGIMIYYFLTKKYPKTKYDNKCEFLNPYDIMMNFKCKSSTLKYMRLFLDLSEEKRFGFNLIDPLSVNHFTLFNKILNESDSKDMEQIFYLTRGIIFYDCLQLNQNEKRKFIRYCEEQPNFIRLFSNLNFKLPFGSIKLPNVDTDEIMNKYNLKKAKLGKTIVIIYDDMFRVPKEITEESLVKILHSHLEFIKSKPSKVEYFIKMYVFIKKTNAFSIIACESWKKTVLRKFLEFTETDRFIQNIDEETKQYYMDLLNF